MAPQEQRHQQQYLAEGVVLPQHHDESSPQKPVRRSPSKQTSRHRALRVVPLVFLTAITYSLVSWSFLSTASSGLLSQDHVHEGEVFLTQYMTTASEESLSAAPAPSLGLLDDHVLFTSGIKIVAPFRLDNFGTGTLVNIKGTVRIQTTTTTSVLVKRKEVIDPSVGLVDKYCVGDDCTLSVQEAVDRIKELNTDASSSMWMQTVVPGATEYQWWLVDGHAVVVSTKCTGDNKDAYLTTDFEPLLDSGCGSAPPPELWNRMKEAVQQLHSSTGIARLSISTTTGSVYVSTLVVSDDTSSLPLKLRLLLEGAREGHVAHAVLTPHHVERIVNDKSWALIQPAKTTSSLSTPTTHEDASSLCQEFTSHVITDESTTAQCKADDYHALEQDFPIRCLSVDSNSQKISAVGQWRLPTFETVIVRVDWPWALGLFFLIVVLQLTNSNETLSRHRHAVPLTVLFYLAAVVVYKYIQPSNAGLFSPESISSTIMDSFYAFTVVHPMTSPWIALSHIFTYWFEVAAWRSKSVQGVLLWYLAYELGASYINEYMHITEHDTAIRCTRVSFVHGMKQYAVDDVVRAYLLPPFFVYLYLLPKLILQWVVPGGLEY